MIEYYDRDGNPVDADEFGRLSGDRTYKVVEQTWVPGFLISTVWLGIDHNLGSTGIAPPVIFETMIFHRDEDGETDFGDIYMNRYCTEQEAGDGHIEAIKWLKLFIYDKVEAYQ
jgi:hypothetical protein